jgi:putative sigma-54 modulation protein
MHIDFKFRNLESSEAIKSYAADKLSRLQKYMPAPLDAQVTFTVEKHLHCVDVNLSADGEHHQGRAEEPDMYASIDVVVDKMHRQLNRSKEQHRNHRRGPAPGDGAGQ